MQLLTPMEIDSMVQGHRGSFKVRFLVKKFDQSQHSKNTIKAFSLAIRLASLD